MEWDLTNRPLRKLLGLSDTQVQGSVQWGLLEISWIWTFMTFMSTGSILKHYESLWVTGFLSSSNINIWCHLRLDILKIFQFLVLQEWYGWSPRVFQICADQITNQKRQDTTSRHPDIYVIYVTSAFLFLFGLFFLCMSSVHKFFATQTRIEFIHIRTVSCKQTKATTFVLYLQRQSTVSGLFPLETRTD